MHDQSLPVDPVAASGGVFVDSVRPALTPALTEIRTLLPERYGSSEAEAWLRGEIRGLAASWLFSSRRQAHFLLEYRTAVFLMPNVRAKLATAVWRAGQQAQNGAKPQRQMASAPRRWRSA